MDRIPDSRPVLLFFTSTRSGQARRMSSLVAWIEVNEKRRLRVMQIDIDRHRRLALTLAVEAAPALLLIDNGRVVDRLDGSVTGRQITSLLQAHLQISG